MPATEHSRTLPERAADAPPTPPTLPASSGVHPTSARRRLAGIKPLPVARGGRRARPAPPAIPGGPDVASGAPEPSRASLPGEDPEAFPGLAATLRSVPGLAGRSEPSPAAAQPGSANASAGPTASHAARRTVRQPGDVTFTLRLPDAGVRRLWSRVAVVRPGLEHFSPSPLIATAALETLVGDALGGGWIEVRRVPGGLVDASGWVIRAHGLDRVGVARLREIVDGGGPIVAPPSTEAEPAHLRRHLRPTRLVLAAAIAALAGLVAYLGPLALPG